MKNIQTSAVEQHPVFINPLEDAPFKILFGPDNKRNMIALLKAILDRDIEDITYIETEKLGLTEKESYSQYDLAVLFADGTRCVVEMQKTNLKYFNYRSVFYCSHLAQLQATEERDRQYEECRQRGVKPRWNYFFPPVYVIGILARGSSLMDKALAKTDPNDYLFHYRNSEIHYGVDMNVDVNYLFLHLDRFKKVRKDCKTLLEQFCWSFKHMNDEKQQPSEFSSEEMENLYRTAYYATLGEDDVHRVKINDDMTTENDVLVAIDEAAEAAREAAKEEWLAKGIEKERANNAAKMKAMNYPIADICKITGLSEKEVQSL